jgi:hypothetical protein
VLRAVRDDDGVLRAVRDGDVAAIPAKADDTDIAD